MLSYFFPFFLSLLSVIQTAASSELQNRALGQPEPTPDYTLPGALITLPLERSMTASALFTEHLQLTNVVIYFDPYGDPYWTQEDEICLSWVIGLPKVNNTQNQCNFDEAVNCINSMPVDPCHQSIRAPTDACKKDIELISGFARISSYYPSVTPISQFNTTIPLSGFWAEKSMLMSYSSKKKDTQVTQRLLTCGNPRLGHGSITDFHFLDEERPTSGSSLPFWISLSSNIIYYYCAILIATFLLY